MRAFLALLPPPEVVEDLVEFLEPRRDAADFPFVAAERWHLTLAFLPDLEERRVDDVLDRLAGALEHREQATVRLAGGGAFPDPARAKVLYADVAGQPEARQELDRLAVNARNAAAGAGARVDGQRFRPHLTLARLASARDVTRWLRVLDTYAGPDWTLDEVALVASHLGERTRRGPRYEVLATLPIEATAAQ